MPNRLPFHQALPLWTLFVVFCFGLGYRTLNRYDPGNIPGVSGVVEFTTGMEAYRHVGFLHALLATSPPTSSGSRSPACFR